MGREKLLQSDTRRMAEFVTLAEVTNINNDVAHIYCPVNQ